MKPHEHSLPMTSDKEIGGRMNAVNKAATSSTKSILASSTNKKPLRLMSTGDDST